MTPIRGRLSPESRPFSFLQTVVFPTRSGLLWGPVSDTRPLAKSNQLSAIACSAFRLRRMKRNRRAAFRKADLNRVLGVYTDRGIDITRLRVEVDPESGRFVVSVKGEDDDAALPSPLDAWKTKRANA